MMTTPNPVPDSRGRGPFVATALALALGGAGYASSVIFTGGLDLGTAAQTPLVAVSNAVSSVVAIALAIQMPTFFGDRFPRWAVFLTAAGLAFLGAFAFALTTVIPHFGTVVADSAVWQAETVWMDLLGYPKQLLLLVGLGALAITGRRRGTLGWPGTIVFGFAALANALLWPYAPGAIITGLAIAFVASSDRTASGRPARTTTVGR